MDKHMCALCKNTGKYLKEGDLDAVPSQMSSMEMQEDEEFKEEDNLLQASAVESELELVTKRMA